MIESRREGVKAQILLQRLANFAGIMCKRENWHLIPALSRCILHVVPWSSVWAPRLVPCAHGHPVS